MSVDTYFYRLFKAVGTKPSDFCWCGSNRSFASCHQKRERLKPVKDGEINHQATIAFITDKYCSATYDSKNCKKQISKAHTIQRSIVLSSMEVNGHVGSFFKNHKALRGDDQVKSGIKKEASVFYGFCEYHDTKIFKDIEVHDVELSAPNCWASSYRAICHELYQKKAAYRVNLWLRDNYDRGMKVHQQVQAQDRLRYLGDGIKKGEANIVYAKNRYEEIAVNNDYSEVCSYVIRFDSPLFVAVSGVISPFYDIKGVRIQNLGNPNVEFQLLAISTVLKDGKGVYILSFLKEHYLIDKYLADIFSRGHDFVKKWLIQSIFAYTENVYFRLDWWDELDSSDKHLVRGYANRGFYEKYHPVDTLLSSLIPGRIVGIQYVKDS
ncbi:hypothetical protein [Cobetia marina]|uniref:hypothetical protein n=1 Tax=Cobetia marina TaxID=28258 RepID=UPI0038578990